MESFQYKGMYTLLSPRNYFFIDKKDCKILKQNEKMNKQSQTTKSTETYYPSYLFDKKSYEDLKKSIEKYTQPNQKKSKKQFIVCSAIWYKDDKKRVFSPKNIKTGIVVCGLRHNNCFEILVELFPSKDQNKLEYKGKIKQGFLTSDNRFVDRKEAAKIAFQSNQTDILKKGLFSEDLY